MASAAIRLSSTMRGFFGMTLSPELEQQAAPFRDKWVAARDGTVNACEAKAVQIRAEVTGPGQAPDAEAAAQIMDEHAARLKTTNAADLAFGSPFFTPAMATTPDRPAMTAPIVHDIVGMDFPKHALLGALYGVVGSTDDLPDTFAVPDVIECETQGALLIAKMRLTFIGDKTAALAAIAQGKDPSLDTGSFAALGIKFNMRELPSATGVLVAPKAAELMPDILKFGKWSAVAPITPREPTDEGVVCPFASGYAIDIPTTVARIGILVGEEFVRKHLCGGATQHAYDPNESDATFICDKDGARISIPMPNTKTNGYQEITGSTFKFDSARMPVDKPNKEYRVWFAGSVAAILNNLDLLSDASLGEAAVLEAATKATINPSEFIHQRTAMYCIAK